MWGCLALKEPWDDVGVTRGSRLTDVVDRHDDEMREQCMERRKASRRQSGRYNGKRVNLRAGPDLPRDRGSMYASFVVGT